MSRPDDVVWKDLPKADAPGITFPHPDDTVRLPDDALGRPQYFDKTTNQLLDHQGVPKQDLTSVPKGPDHPLAEVPKHEPVPAGVGAHTPGHTPGGVAEHTPGGIADNGAHNTHTEPGGGGGTGDHGGTDTTPTGGGHTDTPSTGGHGDEPGVPHQGGEPGHGDGHGSDDSPRVPREDGGTPSVGGDGSSPSHELSPDEKVALNEHHSDLEQRYADDFDELKHDPDHKG
ncbi:hypothetical protein AB0D15_32485, partial [Streptomyces sp. NPDC048551]